MNRLFVGMDVHKEKIVLVGFLQGDRVPVVRETLGGETERVVKRLLKLSREWTIEACYEAGSSGYGLARALEKVGLHCRLAAPSLIPRRPGNRVKTDSRDASELALALRAGTLPFVRIPSREEEEVRGLVRCREDIARQARILKMTISHWVLVRGHRFPAGWKRWTPRHWSWLRALPLSALERETLDHYLDMLFLQEERRRQIEARICELGDLPEYRERVKRLLALKGFSRLAAMRVIAEVMEFRRFKNASSFMKFTGLVPSEFSSSERIRRGRITKAGNSHLRHVLVEAVQRAHSSVRPGRRLLKDLQGVCGTLRQVALRCLARLHHKFWALTKRGVTVGRVRVAMARELAGFVWALMVFPAGEESLAA